MLAGTMVVVQGRAGWGWGEAEHRDEGEVRREGKEEQFPGSGGSGRDGGHGAAPVQAQALHLLWSRAGSFFCP